MKDYRKAARVTGRILIAIPFVALGLCLLGAVCYVAYRAAYLGHAQSWIALGAIALFVVFGVGLAILSWGEQ